MRVAIVNDLRIATEALRRLLASDPECRLAWTAPDGAAAVERCRADLPDLVLMDLVMPVMDGVEATRRIMKATPCPILVVTATIEGNLARVYDALGAGALDAVACPTFGTDGSLLGGEPVLRKIRTLRRLHPRGASAASAVAGKPGAAPGAPAPPAAAAGLPSPAAPPRPGAPPPPPPPPSTPPPSTPRRAEAPATAGAAADARDALAPTDAPFVLLGSSTGGPEALSAVLRGMSKAFTPPVVIVQHLDPEFVPGLVEWLAHETGRTVRAIRPGDRPREGAVLVACTDDHLVLARDGTLRYTVDPAEEPYRPSVDVFFASAAIPTVRPGVAVVLTGMGRDGAEGLLRLRQAGWRTLAQDAATSVVYGMPRAAKEAGAAQQVVALQDIGAHVEAAWRGLATAPGRTTR